MKPVRTWRTHLWGILGIVMAVAPIPAQEVIFEEAPSVSIDTPQQLACGDFDEDGNEDLVVASIYGQAIVLLLGDGAGGFAAAVQFPTPFPLVVVPADFNEDGHLDVVATDYLHGGVSLLLGDGDGNLSLPMALATGPLPYAVAIDDLDEDGHLDLAVVNFGNSTLVALFGDGLGGFTDPQIIANIQSPSYVVAGDFDNDDHIDLVTSSGLDSNVTLFYGNGQGGFPTISSYSLGVDDSIWFMVAVDISGDDRLDLVVPCPNLNVVAVMLASASGGFLPLSEHVVGLEPTEILVTDFTGDALHDLVAMNVASNTVSADVGDGMGGFGDQQSYAIGNESISLATADLDGDDQQDVIVASALDGELRIFLNRTQAPPDAPFLRGDVDASGAVELPDALALLNGLFGSGPQPTCPDAADVDDDGQVQLADALAILGYLYAAFPPPVSPGPTSCGPDETPDELPGCFYPERICP